MTNNREKKPSQQDTIKWEDLARAQSACKFMSGNLSSRLSSTNDLCKARHFLKAKFSLYLLHELLF
jgi:hypothetical protein